MLTPTQQKIVNQSGNIIVRASAGTGKTHTMVSKIKKDVEDNDDYRGIAAITFTIKAANEIKSRLAIDTSNHFIGTNNSFVIEEVIKPFMKDVYGKEFNIEMNTDYSVKFNTFEKGKEKIRTDKIIGTYKNNYKNFIFQLALDILKKSQACQLYLQSRYFKIYIDEYQDCDKEMHNFFMYVCDSLKITTFVVGDEKQSIYMWRGAYPGAFISILDKKNFSNFIMRENFRSCQQIQNYSNLLCEETRYLYKPVNDLSSFIVIITDKKNWSNDVIKYLDFEKKCALLRFTQNDSCESANEMTRCGIEFTYILHPPIENITTSTSWLYYSVASYFIIKKYSEYDLRDEIPTEVINNKNILKIIKIYLNLMTISIKEYDLEKFQKDFKSFANKLGYDSEKEHIKMLYETIIDKKFHSAFFIDELDKVATTFHSSKGLEYDQVILFADDYTMATAEQIYNHYVASTRAKTKLIIVCLRDVQKTKFYIKNINNILNSSSLKMKDIATIIYHK